MSALLPGLELGASRRRRVRRIAAGLTATVDFHGPARGPVRDPILRAIDEDAAPVAEAS